jgi:hypothetical protein
LGGSQAVMLFVSFIISSFFILQIQLVDFIRFSSSWFSVLAVGLFFILALLAFLPGKEPLKFLTINNWFSWVMLGIILSVFIISSAYAFSWAVNWGVVKDWFTGDVFGVVLLFVMAALVSFVITRKV